MKAADIQYSFPTGVTTERIWHFGTPKFWCGTPEECQKSYDDWYQKELEKRGLIEKPKTSPQTQNSKSNPKSEI
jgi:hypothetical protein